MHRKLVKDMINLVVSNNGNGVGEIELKGKLKTEEITEGERLIILFHANVILLKNALNRIESRVEAIF